jgi:hypothetical protein
MAQIVAYAQQAIGPILQYAGQYGATTATISPQVISKAVDAPAGRYTDATLQGWVNELATENHLGADACIFVINPAGISLHDVGANSGYHGKANIPYIAAGVFATGLTLTDEADAYAMVVSHEITEMIVDSNVDGTNPEVCDPCDLDCNNLARCYFDAPGRYLGSNASSAPSGYPYSFYTCAIAKPAGCTNCPAPPATARTRRRLPSYTRARVPETRQRRKPDSAQSDWRGDPDRVLVHLTGLRHEPAFAVMTVDVPAIVWVIFGPCC